MGTHFYCHLTHPEGKQHLFLVQESHLVNMKVEKIQKTVNVVTCLDRILGIINSLAHVGYILLNTDMSSQILHNHAVKGAKSIGLPIFVKMILVVCLIAVLTMAISCPCTLGR